VEIRNNDASIVAVLASDDLSASKRIDSTQASADTEIAVNPTRPNSAKSEVVRSDPTRLEDLETLL
jgi:hypothetical protein